MIPYTTTETIILTESKFDDMISDMLENEAENSTGSFEVDYDDDGKICIAYEVENEDDTDTVVLHQSDIINMLTKYLNREVTNIVSAESCVWDNEYEYAIILKSA